MNGFSKNAGAEPERRFQRPTDLVGRWARHVKTRKFIKIVDATDAYLEVEDQQQPVNGRRVRDLTVKSFCENYNLIPAERAREIKWQS